MRCLRVLQELLHARGAEIDPLDAFMADLEAKVPNASARGLFIDSLPVSAEDSAKREERKGPRTQEALAMTMTGARGPTGISVSGPHARGSERPSRGGQKGRQARAPFRR